MSEKDRQIAERLKNLLPHLDEEDKQLFVTYGEGMANKAQRILAKEATSQSESRK